LLNQTSFQMVQQIGCRYVNTEGVTSILPGIPAVWWRSRAGYRPPYTAIRTGYSTASSCASSPWIYPEMGQRSTVMPSQHRSKIKVYFSIDKLWMSGLKYDGYFSLSKWNTCIGNYWMNATLRLKVNGHTNATHVKGQCLLFPWQPLNVRIEI